MTLKECLYKTLHRNAKPLKAIADELGVSESYLYRSALPDLEDSETGTGCRFPLKQLIPLIRATGDYSTLDHIENALGRVAIPLPRHGSRLSDICRLTMKSVQEFGDLVSEVGKTMEDDRITDMERSQIVKEGYEALQAITALIDAIEEQDGEGN